MTTFTLAERPTYYGYERFTEFTVTPGPSEDIPYVLTGPRGRTLHAVAYKSRPRMYALTARNGHIIRWIVRDELS